MVCRASCSYKNETNQCSFISFPEWSKLHVKLMNVTQLFFICTRTTNVEDEVTNIKHYLLMGTKYTQTTEILYFNKFFRFACYTRLFPVLLVERYNITHMVFIEKQWFFSSTVSKVKLQLFSCCTHTYLLRHENNICMYSNLSQMHQTCTVEYTEIRNRKLGQYFMNEICKLTGVRNYS